MKGCILRLFCLVVFLLAITPVHAEEEALKNRVALSGLLTSSDSWQIEFSYHYMFNKYIGLGALLVYGKYIMKKDGLLETIGTSTRMITSHGISISAHLFY